MCIETHFILKPHLQLHEDEFYLELCARDFEADIANFNGYTVKLMDLSVTYRTFLFAF